MNKLKQCLVGVKAVSQRSFIHHKSICSRLQYTAVRENCPMLTLTCTLLL